MIDIKRTESGFSIRFPKPMKDEFRKLFPTAKWSPGEVCWKVGPRCGKRLEQFRDAAMRAADDIRAREEATEQADISEHELVELRRQLERAQSSFADVTSAISRKNAALSAIDACKAAINSAEVSKAINDSELRGKTAAVMAVIERIIDTNAVKGAYATMCKMAARGPSSQNRFEFERAQQTVRATKDQLENIGLRSPALNRLAGLNWNRVADRDRPSGVSVGRLFDVVTVERED